MKFQAPILAIATCFFLFGPSVGAQDLKIGYVSVDRILRDSGPAKAAQAKLEAEFSKRGRDLEELAVKVKAANEKLEKEAAGLSEVERTRRQREVLDQERDFQRKRRELQEDLERRRNEEYSALIERASRVVEKIGESEKFDLIVQEKAYVSPRVDITDKVIRALGNGGGK